MKPRLLLASALCFTLSGLRAQEPQPGEEVDLAPFGQARVWDGNPGVEWDEPRDIRRVEVEFADRAPDTAGVEYWVSGWPPEPRGGWTKTDTTWQGEWRRAVVTREKEGRVVIYRFAPLSEAENQNARNAPGFTPSFRETLKLRVRLAASAARLSSLRIYGNSRWSMREINVESGCESSAPTEVSATAYNGRILESRPLKGTLHGARLKVLYAEHPPGSNDRTILTIRAGQTPPFGVSADDIIEQAGVYVKPLGIFLGDATLDETFARWRDSGAWRPGQDIVSRTSRQGEQTLIRATAEIPALSLTARSSHPHHSVRYIPLGVTGSREKYGLDAVGSAFVSKRGAKAMKEDLGRMMWEGDEIEYNLATGAAADFRERAQGVRQSLLEDYLPLVTTEWQTDGIDYQEQAYATMLEAPLDETRLRGDEPSLLFLKLTASNSGPESRPARAWFQIEPVEKFELKDGLLLGLANQAGPYAAPRLRAALEAEQGKLELHALPLGASYAGESVLWAVPVPARESRTLYVKIPFRTMESAKHQAAVRRTQYSARLEETLDYWRKVTSGAMRLDVPDREFTNFFRAGLQHILVSIERDISTGFYICPCGTYDYNEFANETMIQARLLDQRGLSGVAWKCMQPYVELQGSHPFPGNFKDGSAIFHGVRVDADHDYTHGGYNLNHGWVLWTLAEHYLFTRDRDWLRGVMPRMLKAANWIISERRATMQRESDGSPVPEYGLLPAGQLEDNEEWQYWFAVNGYTYRGLKAAAQAVAALDPAQGERLKREAAAYREDIRQAAFRAMASAAVVRLRDGTSVPLIPPRVRLHGRDYGWIRNVLYGAETLVDCGVFTADEPIATFILEDYEDNLFMAGDSLSIPDRDWFSRGGVALQPNLVNTFESYLERDQLPQTLRALYNTFAISFYPDVDAFTEWVPTLGIGGGPFYKTSDEAAFLTHLRLLLVREAGDKLYLDSGAPRAWFLPGRSIEVQRAATFFGELGFRIESHVEQGFVEAEVSPPQRNRPSQVVLRLRHPEGRKMTRVELNGRDWKEFDVQRETISLPPGERKIDLRAYFDSVTPRLERK
jgi:hypothetical protein